MNLRKVFFYLGGNSNDLFIIVGDSKMAGTSSVGHVAPVPTLGTVKEYNRSTGLLQNVTGEVLYISQYGSQWPRFGINYNLLTGRIPVICNTGAASSTFYRSDNTQTWDPLASNLYTSNKVYWDDAIIKSGSRPNFLIGLGVNDQSANTSFVSETLAAATRLITQLNSDYNNPTIYINLFSKQPSLDNVMSGPLKVLIKSWETTYSNVYCTINEGAILANGATTDGTHYNETGNNRFGVMMANYVASTESDKDIRRLKNSNFYTDISTTYKNAYSTYVTSAKANGYWNSLAALFVFRSEVAANYLSNIIGYGAGVNSNTVTFTANNKIGTNGTDSSFNSNFWPTYASSFGITQDDIFAGTKTGTVVTPVGVNAGLFGALVGAGLLLQRSSFGNIAFYINGGAVNDTDTIFDNNTPYALQRDGAASCAEWKNGSVKKSSTTASTGIPTDAISFGKSQSSWYLQSEGYYLFVAKNTGFNYAAFLTDIETLLSALA